MDNFVEKQRRHFDNLSNMYYSARTHPNHKFLKELIWRYFFKRNELIADEVKRVLEPMCGMAEGYEIIRKYLTHDFEYLGFDYSESMVDIAQRANEGIKIVWDDVTNFRPKGEIFDLIILVGGLHHVYRHTSVVLANLAESLRSGGYFVSFEPTQNNALCRMIREKIYYSNSVFDSETEKGFEYSDLQKIFINSGFQKIDEVYPGLLSYVLYYNPDAFSMLNIGNKSLVEAIFGFDRFFWDNSFGRKLSFATLTLWKKDD